MEIKKALKFIASIVMVAIVSLMVSVEAASAEECLCDLYSGNQCLFTLSAGQQCELDYPGADAGHITTQNLDLVNPAHIHISCGTWPSDYPLSPGGMLNYPLEDQEPEVVTVTNDSQRAEGSEVGIFLSLESNYSNPELVVKNQKIDKNSETLANSQLPIPNS